MRISAAVRSTVLDLRYGLRSLARSPMFTTVAVLTLAIGIGVATAMFAVVNSVLLEPLPYPRAHELVSIRHVAPGAPGLGDASGGLNPSPSMYFTYADENRSFEALGLWSTVGVNVTGIDEPEEVRAIIMTDGVLDALAVPPLLGRPLGSADQARDPYRRDGSANRRSDAAWIPGRGCRSGYPAARTRRSKRAHPAPVLLLDRRTSSRRRDARASECGRRPHAADLDGFMVFPGRAQRSQL